MTNKKIQTTIGKNENNNAKINLISKFFLVLAYFLMRTRNAFTY